MAKRRDPQQQAVYRWEATWKGWNRSDSSLKELRDVLRWACKRYGLKRLPVLKQHGGGMYAWAIYCKDTRSVISMQRARQKNVPTLLHEVAHIICDTFFEATPGQVLPDHGPEWLGIYLALLIEADIAPALALHSTAHAAGLKWMTVNEIGPRAIRKFAAKG